MNRINVKGSIIPNSYKEVYEYFGMEHTCPMDVISALEKAGGSEIVIEINSGGGSVFAGSEIYTKIKSYEGKTKTEIVGLAASAASIIAMASDETVMSPSAQLMIHPVSINGVSGNSEDLFSYGEQLSIADETLLDVYALKTNLPKDELRSMLKKETWMKADEAKKLGFIDGVMFESREITNDLGNLLSDEVISKTKMLIKNNEVLDAENKAMRLKLAQSQLNELKEGK